MSFTNSTVLIHEASGDYPLDLNSLKTRHTNISFGTHIDEDFIKELGYAEVVSTIKPEGDVVTEGAPVKGEDGVWRQFWAVRSFTPEEVAATLEKAKTAALALIATRLSTALEVGAPFDFTVVSANAGVQHAQMRNSDRTNVLGLKQEADRRIEAGDLSASIPFRTYEDNTLLLTPAQMLCVSWGVSAGYQEAMAKSWELKDAVRLASTVAELPVIPAAFEATLRNVE